MDSKENYFNIKQMTETFKNVKKYSMHSGNVLELFMDICKKLDKQSKEYLSKVIPIEEEKNTLCEIDGIILLNYLKQIVVYLIKTKVELEEKQIESPTQYENLIQKLEADVRSHIRVEQQLRLYAETLQQRIDEFVVEREQQNEIIKEYEQQIKQKNKDIVVYQSELRKIVNKHQQKNTKMITEPMVEEIEQKIQNPNILHFRKSSQTLQNAIKIYDEKPQSPPNKSMLNSYKNSPDKIPSRKISVTNYAETKAIKQPVFIKQPCPMTYQHLKTEGQQSYRSNSQENKQIIKIKKQ